MYSTILLVLLAVAGSQAKSVGNETEESFSRFDVDARLAGTTIAAAGLPYIAYIQDKTPAFIGSGIVVNKYWILTMTNVVASAVVADLTVFAGRLDPKVPASVDGVVRKVKEIKHKITPAASCSATVLVDCVSIVRVCPSFADSYFAMTRDATFTDYQNPLKNVNMYFYQAKPTAIAGAAVFPLQKATKTIGELCECKDIPLFDKTKHVCLSENAGIGGELGDDTKAMVIMNSDDTKIVGFLIKKQDTTAGTGEVVLHLGAYDAWVLSDALIAPYVYA